jgi:hypothetical protein
MAWQNIGLGAIEALDAGSDDDARADGCWR